MVYAKANGDSLPRHLTARPPAPSMQRSSRLSPMAAIGLVIALVFAAVMAQRTLSPSGSHQTAESAETRTPLPRAPKDGYTPVLYSAAWCPYCKATKKLLEMRGVPYVEIDVEKEPERQRALTEKFNVGGFPILEVGNEIVVGYQPDAIDRLLVKAKHNHT